MVSASYSQYLSTHFAIGSFQLMAEKTYYHLSGHSAARLLKQKQSKEKAISRGRYSNVISPINSDVKCQ